MSKTTKKFYIKSGKDDIYVEIGYPEKVPAPTVILPHGLRSSYPGFLNNFAKKLRKAGYITVKFFFVGTGKSSGNFEDKLSTTMLQNYRDVLAYVKADKDVKDIGLVGRSNAGDTAIAEGPDPRIKAYALMAVACFYSKVLASFVEEATLKGKFFYHPSYKRAHTKGEGRLPMDFVENAKIFDETIAKNIGKVKNVIYFEGTKDEVLSRTPGNWEYMEKNLTEPRKMVRLKGCKHSLQGKQKVVFKETIAWFAKYLPV